MHSVYTGAPYLLGTVWETLQGSPTYFEQSRRHKRQLLRCTAGTSRKVDSTPFFGLRIFNKKQALVHSIRVRIAVVVRLANFVV